MSTTYQSFTSGGNASIGLTTNGVSSSSPPPIITTSASSPNHPDKTMQGPSISPTQGPTLLGARGGSLKVKDSWRRIGEQRDHGPGVESHEHSNEGAAGLLRHTSLPGRCESAHIQYGRQVSDLLSQLFLRQSPRGNPRLPLSPGRHQPGLHDIPPYPKKDHLRI